MISIQGIEDKKKNTTDVVTFNRTMKMTITSETTRAYEYVMMDAKGRYINGNNQLKTTF